MDSILRMEKINSAKKGARRRKGSRAGISIYDFNGVDMCYLLAFSHEYFIFLASARLYCLFSAFSCYSVTRLLTTLAANIFRLLCLHFFNISRALHSFRESIIPIANECVVYNNFIVSPKWNLELSSLQAYIFMVVETPGVVIKLRKNTSYSEGKNFKAPSIFREGFYGIDAA